MVHRSNPDEVVDYKWLLLDDIKNAIKQNPQEFAAWFKIYIDQINIAKLFEDHIKNV